MSCTSDTRLPYPLQDTARYGLRNPEEICVNPIAGKFTATLDILTASPPSSGAFAVAREAERPVTRTRCAIR